MDCKHKLPSGKKCRLTFAHKHLEPSARVYNEIYCHRDHTVAVEKAMVDLRMEHPEWELDMSIGAGNWEDAED